MSNIMRISGMATGMDTEATVKQLMDAERIRLNKYNEAKEIKKWTQEAYNDTNKDIANFILDTKKELGVGIGGSVSGASWIKEATSSNTSVFDAKATSSAVTGTHSLEVVDLAEGVNVASKGDITDDKFGTAGSVTFKTSDNKSITVNYTADDTPSSLTKLINKETDLGLISSYDSKAKRFFLSTKETGSSAQINITNDSGNLFVGAGSKLDTDLTLNNAQNGKDAKINFDGANGITYSSNNFTINGISVTAKSKGTSTITVDTDTDEVFDKIKGFVDKYNGLIDKLNKKTTEKRYRDYKPLTSEQKEAMDEKTIELWEKKAKSGLLRGEEHIDRMLGTARSGLYEDVYSDYDKKDKLSGFSFISEIGITTGNYKDKGKLKIDETKLKDAISKDVEGVMDLLFKTSDVTESEAESDSTKRAERRAETGLINRLYGDLVDGMKSIIDKSGTGENASLYRNVKTNILIDFVTKKGSISLLDKDVLGIEKQITRENNRLSSVESRYWRQFTALEKAMSKMNSQSSWLMSQMGGGM